MMTVQDLFKTTAFEPVFAFIEEHLQPEANEGSYRGAWDEIQTIVPLPAKNWSCHVRKGDVSGITPDDPGVRYAIEFRPWAEWLNMQVETALEPVEALANILYEMTFIGYTAADVAEEGGAQMDAMMKSMDEIRVGTAKATPFEEAVRNLDPNAEELSLEPVINALEQMVKEITTEHPYPDEIENDPKDRLH